jgi:hypothetical protein
VEESALYIWAEMALHKSYILVAGDREEIRKQTGPSQILCRKGIKY